MSPFAIPLEDRRNSGMAIYVKGVFLDEYHKEHIGASTHTAVLANGETSPCPTHTLPLRGWSIRRRNAGDFCSLH